jgi:elongation factor G
MDKFGANFEESLKSIESKLQTNPLPVQIPIGREKTFSGLIDLINMKKLIWDQNSQDESTSGKKYEVNDLDKNDSFYERAFKHRLNLIEKLAQANEQFAEILLDKYNLNYEKVDDNLLLESFIRQSCLNNTITPVLCGSSFKNIGVQPLMDAIVKYLPHPLDLEKNNFQKFFENSKTFVGLCFKIIHDHLKMRKRINPSTNTASLQTSISSLPQNSNTKTRIDEAKSDEDNSLCFIRVYNGELQNKAKLFNVNRQCREEVDKIYIPYSNQIKTVNKISNGNIALISGLSKMTITGDLLVSSKQDYDKAHEKVLKASQKEDDENAKLIEASIDIPSSVFFCTVEPESDAEEKRLYFALSCLEREDPSLKVLKNEEENLGQTIIQGMGELHLEIIKDRLLREYKLKAYFGPLNIAYKEMPTKQSSELFTFERSINEKKNFVQIELEILPKLNHRFESVQLNLRPNSENKGFQNNREFPVEYLESINNGVRSALNKGILLRYPMVNVDVRLNSFNANSKIHLPYISSAAYGCTTRALQKAECVVTQPIMQLEVNIQLFNCDT